MTVPLLTIFQKSLEEYVITDDWKLARVSPIFKKDAKNQACNYRPVSLTSVPCKIMESLVTARVTLRMMTSTASEVVDLV